MSIQIFPDRQTLIDSTAAYIAELAVKSIRDSGRFTLSLRSSARRTQQLSHGARRAA
jgi:hypothetical protein